MVIRGDPDQPVLNTYCVVKFKLEWDVNNLTAWRENDKYT